MEKVNAEEIERVWDGIANGGKVFDHLPFVGLNNTNFHRVGILRLHPKQKTLHVERWDQLGWRPLASYAGHRWKRLFALTARWATYALALSKAGNHVASPSAVLEQVKVFNDRIKRWYGRTAEIDFYTLDLTEFFTYV